MHQPADTSFLARRGLGFGLSTLGGALGWVVIAVGDVAVLFFAIFLGWFAAALASRASFRRRLLRWSLFSLGCMD